MSMPAYFDTLRYVETLKTGGVPERQAKAEAEALSHAFGEWGSGFLATKVDIAELKSEIKSDIAELRGDIAGLRNEFKSDIAELRSEIKGDIAELRTGDIQSLRLELADRGSEIKLVKWMCVTIVAGVLSLVSRTFF